MALLAPNLDDRSFEDLMEEARAIIRRRCPEWTDLSPSDPGIVLLETFAYLTELMMFRLNKIPEKTYIEFLRFLGIEQLPPSAASVILTFSLPELAESAVVIPKNTVVTTETDFKGGRPEFITNKEVVIEKGEQSVDVPAHHCQRIEGELAGVGNGKPGLHVAIKNAPALFDPAGSLDFVVGVETDPEELEVGEPVMQIAGQDKVYRIWEEVDKFSVSFTVTRRVYTVNRLSGSVQFSHALRRVEEASPEDKGIVKKGQEVRVWYYIGGGPDGNIPKETLTVIKDSRLGGKVTVTNREAATGGKDIEFLESALSRAVQELVSRGRAVTASDFELIATMNPAVARARAFAKAALWKYAEPGTVSVLLVPEVNIDRNGSYRLTSEELIAWETERVLQQVKQELDDRKPLGTQCDVEWVRYKPVSVRAKVVVQRGIDREQVKKQVEELLYTSISPLPARDGTMGWEFGKTLHISHIYSMILKVKGILHVEQASLSVDNVPEKDVTAVAADVFHANLWFAAAEHTLFRSLNVEGGWDAIKVLPDEVIESVCVNKRKPGLLAMCTKKSDENTSGSAVYISHDCGETWGFYNPNERWAFQFEIEALAWSERQGIPLLFIATDKGLYELLLTPGATPRQVEVREEESGYYAMAIAVDIEKKYEYVIVASQGKKGVYLSSRGGRSGTFTEIGFKDKDIRTLTFQTEELRTFLWLGETVIGSERGTGCYRLELSGQEILSANLHHFQEGWDGGSCRAIDFMSDSVIAATHRAGVLSLNMNRKEQKWEKPEIECGLPIRGDAADRLFFPVNALSVNPEKERVLAATPEGVFTSEDGKHFVSCSNKIFMEKVPLADTQLFCSGEHEIIVEVAD